MKGRDSVPEEQGNDEEDAVRHGGVVEVLLVDGEGCGHDRNGTHEQQVRAGQDVAGATEGPQVDGPPHELAAGGAGLERKGNDVGRRTRCK